MAPDIKVSPDPAHPGQLVDVRVTGMARGRYNGRADGSVVATRRALSDGTCDFAVEVGTNPRIGSHTVDIRDSANKTTLKAATYGVVATPPPPPPPAGVVHQFPLTGTPAEFMAALADLSIDRLEMAGGPRHWPLQIINIQRPTRPLVVCPKSGDVLTFFGDQANGPAFHFGRGGIASDIAFDFPNAVFSDYTIGDTGIVWQGNVKRMRFGGTPDGKVTVQRVTAVGQGPIYSWALYLSADAAVSPQDSAFDYWSVKGNPSWRPGHPETKRNISALQLATRSGSVMANLSARHWDVDGVDITVYGSADGTNCNFDDFLITDSKRSDREGTVYFADGLYGVFSNMRSDLGNLEKQGTMTRGPGNVGI